MNELINRNNSKPSNLILQSLLKLFPKNPKFFLFFTDNLTLSRKAEDICKPDGRYFQKSNKKVECPL